LQLGEKSKSGGVSQRFVEPERDEPAWLSFRLKYPRHQVTPADNTFAIIPAKSFFFFFFLAA